MENIIILKSYFEPNLYRDDMTPNEVFAQMVESGEISPDIKGLYLFNAGLTDISPLNTLTNLTYLDLGYNNITDFTPLSRLSNLTELHLENCSLSDLSSLYCLTKLKTLEISGIETDDISPLASLSDLTSLDLWFNGDLSPLKNLIGLKYLRLPFMSNSQIQLKDLCYELPNTVINDVFSDMTAKEKHNEKVFCPIFMKYICDGCCTDFSYISDYDAEYSFCDTGLKEDYYKILDDNGIDLIKSICEYCRDISCLYPRGIYGGYYGDHEFKTNKYSQNKQYRQRQRQRIKVEYCYLSLGYNLSYEDIPLNLAMPYARCPRYSKINKRYKKRANKKMRNLSIDTDKLPISYHKKIYHNMWYDW